MPITPLTTLLPSLHSGGFLDITPDVLLLISHRDETVEWANHAAHTMLGYDVLIGAALADLFIHNGIAITRELLIGMIASGEKILVGLKHRDGQRINFGLVAARGDSGRTYLILRLIAEENVSDICEKCGKILAAEQRAAAMELRLREIIGEDPWTGIMILDREMHVLYINNLVVKLLGYETGDIAGVDFASLIHPEQLKLYIDLFKRALRRSGKVTYDGVVTLKTRWNNWASAEIAVRGILQEKTINGAIIYMRNADK